MTTDERRARAICYEKAMRECQMCHDEALQEAENFWEDHLDAAIAFRQSDEQAGMVTVPREPISRMGAAGWKILDREDMPLKNLSLPTNLPQQVFRAMIEAYEDKQDD